MIRAARQIAVSAVILILFCLVCRFTLFRSYTVHMPLPQSVEQELREGEMHAVIDKPEHMQIGSLSLRPGELRFQVKPAGRGEVNISVYDVDNDVQARYTLYVSRTGTIYDPQSGGFTGDTAVLTATTLFWLLVSAVMIWNYFQAKGPAYYAYSTIYFAGFSLFSLATGLEMLIVSIRHLARPTTYSMYSIYSSINEASLHFMMLTLPPIVIFAVMMAASNIALLRHERKVPQNVLGLGVSLLLLVGEAIGLYLYTRGFSGSEWEWRIHNTLQNVYATVFAYFECMLAGSVICGVQSARRQPACDKDFIIILGCWFRKDGTLPPLLRGRADRAIRFWRRQKAETGREAVFIPSGGQGANEPMPEAEAIRRYLVSQQIPEALICPEDRAANTYQNMLFSKEIIQRMNPDGKALFATTNYHVFRSGLWANQAGLHAEGIGEKTKWWFWPNAFMRECAGLLCRRWKQEILLLVLLVAFFSLLSMVLG